MSFLTDLFSGNFGNLGEDIAPQNIFKDFGSSFQNQPEWAKIAEIALPAAAAAFVAPEALPALGEAFTGVGTAAEAADWTAAGLDVGGTLGPGVGAATTVGATETAPLLSDAELAALQASPGAGALASVGDPAFAGGAGAVPFTNMTLGGGFPSVEGGAGAGGIMDFSPSTEIATGGNVLPNVAAAGGGGGGAAVTDPAYLWGTSAVPGMTTGGVPITGGVAPPGATAPGFLDQAGNVIGSIGTAATKAAPWLGAAGLGYSLFQGYQQNQALKAEQAKVQQQADAVAAAGQASLAAAQPDLAIGQALMTGGPVPGPMQAMLDNVRNAQRARIIQGYGTRGQSTDPNQNSALAQDLNNLDTNLAAFREQLGQQIVTTANQLLSSGASATQISENMAIQMQNLDMRLQQMTGNAIANFAAAMSGGTMKVAGSGTGQNLNINLTGPGQLAA